MPSHVFERDTPKSVNYTHWRPAMRTNIEIDETLIRTVMKKTGAPTKKAAVEKGLLLQLQIDGQKGIRKFRGKVKWEGNLEESRLGRVRD
jgi:Arc/MetJ family transcription regulator